MNKVLINTFQNYYGKETIDLDTHSKSSGKSGNYSTNYQISARELMTPDEVRLLDNKYALLFIRGERAIKDQKYDILKHPNVVFTTDGKGKPYIHGVKEKIANPIGANENIKENNFKNILDIEEFSDLIGDYEIYTEEEIEEMILEGSL